jgi:hypothetical protein
MKLTGFAQMFYKLHGYVHVRFSVNFSQTVLTEFQKTGVFMVTAANV